MFRPTNAPRSVKPAFDVLEDRLTPASVPAFNSQILTLITQPPQSALGAIQAAQTKLNHDLSTIRTDAGNLNFNTESAAQQTTVDQDYAVLMQDVETVHQLDQQIHNEVTAGLMVILSSHTLGGKNKQLNQQAVTAFLNLLQSQIQADNINGAVFSQAPVTASPIAGQGLAPQYPAFNMLPGFPG